VPLLTASAHSSFDATSLTHYNLRPEFPVQSALHFDLAVLWAVGAPSAASSQIPFAPAIGPRAVWQPYSGSAFDAHECRPHARSAVEYHSLNVGYSSDYQHYGPGG
jgi:hypothetical protein